jgi:GTP-binding protein HflX
VALVGYTNAGKSSILRGLSGQHDILVEDRLFATLDTLTREVDLGEGYRARVVDTVGFIRKLPHHLVASFRATLEEAREADVLLHVVDASHPEWEEHWSVVEGVLAELELDDKPVLPVFNKMDAVEDPVGVARRVRELHPDAIFVTTVRTDGLEPLKGAIRAREQATRPTVRVEVPHAQGRLLAALYQAGEVIGRRPVDGGVEVSVRLPLDQVARFRAAGLEVRAAPAR